jgi:hypothetical protein
VEFVGGGAEFLGKAESGGLEEPSIEADDGDGAGGGLRGVDLEKRGLFHAGEAVDVSNQGSAVVEDPVEAA